MRWTSPFPRSRVGLPSTRIAAIARSYPTSICRMLCAMPLFLVVSLLSTNLARAVHLKRQLH